MSKATDDVLAERQRQIDAEGWTAAHDDEHGDRSLATAGVCYAKQYVGRSWLLESYVNGEGEKRYASDEMPDDWPESWAEEWWKPKNPRRDLVRAAALLIAEIERLDRQALNTPKKEISDREWAAQPSGLREGCVKHVDGVGDL